MADYLTQLILSAILTWPPVAGGLGGFVIGVFALGNAGALFGLILGATGGVLIRRRQLLLREAEQRNRDKGVSSLARGARHFSRKHSSRSRNH